MESAIFYEVCDVNDEEIYYALGMFRTLDDMPDGAWFYTLEIAAQEFIDKHNLKFANSNIATHQYLRMLPHVEVTRPPTVGWPC